MKLSDLKKYILSVIGLATLCSIIKKIFKYILRLNSEKSISDFKSEMSAQAFKDMQKTSKNNKEIDEKIDNMSDDVRNKLLQP